MKVQSKASAILASMALAVAMVATAGVAQAMGRQGGGHDGAGPTHRHGPGGQGGAFGSERMLDQLNATPEQKAQVHRIMEAARQDQQAQREAGQQLRQRMMQALAQPNVDAAAVEAIRQQMSAQHDQASKRMAQAMVEAARVLTPEQRQKAAEHLAKRRDMMQRHQRERDTLDKPRS